MLKVLLAVLLFVGVSLTATGRAPAADAPSPPPGYILDCNDGAAKAAAVAAQQAPLEAQSDSERFELTQHWVGTLIDLSNVEAGCASNAATYQHGTAVDLLRQANYWFLAADASYLAADASHTLLHRSYIDLLSNSRTYAKRARELVTAQSGLDTDFGRRISTLLDQIDFAVRAWPTNF